MVIVNDTFYNNIGHLGSDTFSIPSTTGGNTLVVAILWFFNQAIMAPGGLTDSAGDVFFQTPNAYSPNGGDPNSCLAQNSTADIWYFPNVPAGVTSISFFSSANPYLWIYEISPAILVDSEHSDVQKTSGICNQSTAMPGPNLAGTSGSNFYVDVAVSDQNVVSVSSPWTLDPNQIFANGPAYMIGSGIQQATFTQSPTGKWCIAGAVFGSPGTFCGGLPTQAVGNPLTKGSAHSVRG